MAADTRQYKSKEQDGQGNEVIIRDQQLVEQTSQTTMASGEYFEIVDVDGRMAKIPKDNMIGVVREALGTLLNSLTDQTTVAKFLTLNGNTLGASAAATAASVLGVADGSKMMYRGSYSHVSDIPIDRNGIYCITTPSEVFGGYLCYVMTIHGYSTYIFQIAMAINSNQFAFRFGANSWKIIT